MIKVRNSVFETNSSSIHSIVLCDEPFNYDFMPPFVYFKLGDYGWSMGLINDSWGRASYFYTAACILRGHDAKDEIIELLAPLGIECIFDEENPPRYTSYGEENYRWLENGNIDHVDECEDFVNALMSDGDALARFIFDDRSFIVTGNDNCDEIDYKWHQDKVAKADAYSHTIFYKGN